MAPGYLLTDRSGNIPRMLPPLTPNERYIIAYLKSDRVHTARWAMFIARCVPTAVFAYGFIEDNRAMIFTGFVALFGFDVWFTAGQSRTTRVIRSILVKLDPDDALS